MSLDLGGTLTSRIISPLLVITLLFGLATISNPAFAETQLPIQQCQLPSGPRPGSTWGFPRSADLLPADGEIRIQIIFVDFPDAKGTDEKSLESTAKRYKDNFQKFYTAQSYGRVKFSFSYVPEYFRLNKKSSTFQMNLGKGQDGSGGLDYFRSAIEAADKKVDYSEVDLVVVIPSNTNREITYGPAVVGVSVVTDEKIITRGAVAGIDSRLRSDSTEWVWMAHEIGHLFGIGHPWKTNTDPQGRWLSKPDYPVWDLMLHLDNGLTADFLGWNRFLIGWLGEGSVVCIDSMQLANEPKVVSLAPITSKNEKEKFLFIKTGDYTGIAIEVRAPLGLNKFPKSWGGPLVYTIDTRKVGNEGFAKIVKGNRLTQRGLTVGTLVKGQTVSTSGIKIKFQKKTGDNYEISLSR